MISNSTLLITIIDIAVVVLAAMTIRQISKGGFFVQRSTGHFVIASGIGVAAAVFLLDLLAMHASPAFYDEAGTAELVRLLRLELVWYAAPLAFGLVFGGFVALNRTRERDEMRVRLMTDALPLGVAYLDTDGCYHYANALYANLCGVTPKEMLGKKVPQLLTPSVFAGYADREALARSGERQSFEARVELQAFETPRFLQFDLFPDVGPDRNVVGLFVFVRDVTDRSKLEREVIHAAEEERLAIARDLHDALGQVLTGLSLAQSALLRRLEAEGSSQTSFVKELTSTTQRAIAQTKQFTRALAPTMEGGLDAALQELADEVSLLYGVPCTAFCPRLRVELDHDAAMHLYRIAQESVRNAAMHGQPDSISLSLTTEDGQLVLEVLDDGQGIAVDPEQSEGYGLRSMHYRARLIGAKLHISRRAEGGTQVRCRLPLPKVDAAAQGTTAR